MAEIPLQESSSASTPYEPSAGSNAAAASSRMGKVKVALAGRSPQGYAESLQRYVRERREARVDFLRDVYADGEVLNYRACFYISASL